jgi:GT2 family glycosyltransferase
LIPLSIVIPTYNTAAMTLECCRAAIASLPVGGEVIVADDGSTDGTSDLLRATLPAVRIVRLERNRGFGAAANAGVAAAKGAIILLLNSDARIDRDAMTALLDAFAADARLGIAGARLINAGGTPQWSGGPKPSLLWMVVMVSGIASVLARRRRAAARGDVDWVSGAAMAFRSAVWNDAGPFNESYRFYAQDLELCIRARERGWQVRLIEDALVVHGGGETLRRSHEIAELPHDPALLWLDLLTWGRAHYGRAWAMCARILMCGSAAFRIAGRSICALFLRGDARRLSQSTTAVYAAALRQLVVERKKTAGQNIGRVA